MASFSAKPNEMAALAAKLDELAQHLRQADDGKAGLTRGVGEESVSHALREFINQWDDGFRKIVGHIDGVSERLKTAEGAYRDTDSSMARSFEDSLEDQGTTPAGAGHGP